MLLAAGYALILAFEILDRLPALTVAVLMLSVAIIALRIGVLVLLFAESRWFPWAFLAVGALGILLGVMTVGDQPRPARTVGQMLTTAAWMIYVVVSRRVNLTFRKRINVREVPDGA
jgi:phosphate/sulfate permease